MWKGEDGRDGPDPIWFSRRRVTVSSLYPTTSKKVQIELRAGILQFPLERPSASWLIENSAETEIPRKRKEPLKEPVESHSESLSAETELENERKRSNVLEEKVRSLIALNRRLTSAVIDSQDILRSCLDDISQDPSLNNILSSAQS
jgi:hypothetical protein